jgi:type IV pilus assembly protein PilN
MIRVNLLPVRELKAEVNRRRELTLAGAALVCAAVLLSGVYLYEASQVTRRTTELDSIRKELQVLTGNVKEVGELENKIKEFKSKYKVISDLGNKKTGPVLVMESLASAMPASLWLTELKQTGSNIVLNGLTTDNQTLAEFIKSLSRSTYFHNVELIESTQADEKTGPYKKFSIQSVVSYQPATRSGSSAVKEEKKS